MRLSVKEAKLKHVSRSLVPRVIIGVLALLIFSALFIVVFSSGWELGVVA